MSKTRPTVLITGCSPGGIGHALAREYHSRGLHVFATARRPEVLSDLAELGITTLALDVTNIETVKAARDKVAEVTGGTLDILVNNAGIAYSDPAAELDISRVRSMFDTNVFGVMAMAQEFIHLVVASKGQILNIGSVAGTIPLPFLGAYSASKAALHAWGDSLRVEMKPFGVQVVTITTASVQTNMSDSPEKINDEPPFREGSLFTPMTSIYQQRRVELAKTVSGMSAETYARNVVSATYQRQPSAWVYKGVFSSRIWLMNWLLPRSIIEMIMARQYGLDQFAALLKSEEKNK